VAPKIPTKAKKTLGASFIFILLPENHGLMLAIILVLFRAGIT
jgi:hypothetical protein